MSRTTTLAAAAMFVSTGAALAQSPSLPELPAALKPGELKVYLAVPAKGVQIYRCTPERGNWIWMFKAPEAELDDATGKAIGEHYGGPTWEGNDGGNAIPWLLLDIKSRDGSGQFTQAAAILRVNTVGGTAPASGCEEAHAGTEQRVPYT